MARTKPVELRPNIRRRRTGCLTCRGRRVRCGEEKPTCKNCSRKSRTCIWAKDGHKFLHHHPGVSTRPEELQQQTQSLDDNSFDTTQPMAATEVIPLQPTTILPNTNDAFQQVPSPAMSKSPESSRLNSYSSDSVYFEPHSPAQRKGPEPLVHSLSSETVGIEELSCWQSELSEPCDKNLTSSQGNIAASSICRTQSARLKNLIDIEHQSPIPPNLEPNGEPFSDWQTLGASETVVNALSGNKEMKLLQTYLRECAHWFDAIDCQRHYGRKSIARMMNCPPWRAAALALSAKFTELHQKQELTSGSLSLHLYQLAVQLAIDSISGRFDCIGTTAGCVALAVYEMMTVTYQDWRRHLRGCTSIYSHNNWNGDCAGLIGASFWNYAKIDIWAAFCANTETMLPPEKWFNFPDKVFQTIDMDEDRHAHTATWLLARVNNFIHSTETILENPENQPYDRLVEDLGRWQELGADITRPVMRHGPEGNCDQPFPTVLFSNESSTVAHTMWHTAMVLLLEFKSTNGLLGPNESPQNLYEHALTACGIIETNSHFSCVLVDAIHPLWICGRYVRTKSEKFGILELLAQIERDTGWKTGWRANSLREMWSLS